MSSREKGAVGERELADELQKLGMIARRSVQYCGKSGEASDLIVDGLRLHIECKRCERVRLPEWIDQARNDAAHADLPWAIFTRQNRQPWLVVQTLEAWTLDSIVAQAAIAHRRRIIDEAVSAHDTRP